MFTFSLHHRGHFGFIEGGRWCSVYDCRPYTPVALSSIPAPVALDILYPALMRSDSWGVVTAGYGYSPEYVRAPRSRTLFWLNDCKKSIITKKFHSPSIIDVEDNCLCKFCKERASHYHHRVCPFLKHLNSKALLARVISSVAAPDQEKKRKNQTKWWFFSFCFLRCNESEIIKHHGNISWPQKKRHFSLLAIVFRGFYHGKKNTPFLFFEYLENGESDHQTDFFHGFGSKFVIQRYKIF